MFAVVLFVVVSRAHHRYLLHGWPVRVAVAAVLLVAVGCGGSGGGASTTSAAGDEDAPTTRHVPRDYQTIAEAVDSARPGDMVLIEAGTYDGSVTVETEDITIRGVDRNRVIVQGDGEAENGFLVLSDGVTVENMTVRGFRSNGVMFSGSYGAEESLHRFRAAYLTVHDNGLYGIYAFNARGGTIEHNYASGHPDGGLYVGQCDPCETVVTDLTAEGNAVGYLGTNSGGDLFIVNSIFRANRVGVQPNSSTKEQFAPGQATTIAGNLIADNDNPVTPRSTEGFGVGIGIGGAHDTLITRNRIVGNPTGGVIVADNEAFNPIGTRVEANVLASNGVDLMVASSAAKGLCFQDNEFASSQPTNLEAAWPCGATGSGGFVALPPIEPPPAAERAALPEPPEQPSMKDATVPPPRALPGLPSYPNLEEIEVPSP